MFFFIITLIFCLCCEFCVTGCFVWSITSPNRLNSTGQTLHPCVSMKAVVLTLRDRLFPFPLTVNIFHWAETGSHWIIFSHYIWLLLPSLNKAHFLSQNDRMVLFWEHVNVCKRDIFTLYQHILTREDTENEPWVNLLQWALNRSTKFVHHREREKCVNKRYQQGAWTGEKWRTNERERAQS